MKLTVGTVHGSSIDGWFFGPWTDIFDNPVVAGKIDLTPPITVRSGPDLAAGRGHLVNEFLANRDGDALLMLDSDMGFSITTIVEMWDVFRELPVHNGEKAQILGGLAFILGGDRVDPRNMKPNMWVDDPERGEPYMVQCITYLRDTLSLVAATGGACLMVSREVLEACTPNPFAIYGMPDGDRLSEDLSFCRRARDLGYPTYVHTALKFGHAKTVLVGEADYEPVLTAYAEIAKENERVQSH